MSASVVPACLVRGESPNIEEISLQEKIDGNLSENGNGNPMTGKVQIMDNDLSNNEKENFMTDPPVLDKESTKNTVSPSLSKSEAKKLTAKLRRADNLASKAFKMFDTNGDGTIAVSELANLADKLGKDLDKEVILQIIKQCDTDGDSELTLQEFTAIFQRFNEERLKVHQTETALLKEQFDLEVDLSTSKKCSHACVGTAETTFCVYHKFLLLLASTIVMAVMIPLFRIAYQARELFYCRR